MKKNITITMPLSVFKKRVIKYLANNLKMNYSDANDIIEYDIHDINKALLELGENYVEKMKIKSLKKLYSYGNSVIGVSSHIVNNNDLRRIIKENSVIVFIKLNKNSFMHALRRESDNKDFICNRQKEFDVENNILSKNSDLTVYADNSNAKDISRLIIDNLIKYYKEKL